MSYQVPQHINKNKIFIVNRSEIEGRLDAHYNKPVYSDIWHKLLSMPIPLTTLKDYSETIFSGITPKSGGEAYVSKNGIPFVRSGDFSDTNIIDFSSLLLLKEEVHSGLMKNSQLRKGDVLIAIVGATIGKIGVYKYDIEANINQAICAVRLKETLNPYYVQAFLQTNLGQKILERIKRPVARANINLEEVGNIPIPLLTPARQKEIVNYITEANRKKQEKEREAQQLLDSIDRYLLNELGVTIPRIKQDINNRMFIVHKKDIIGRYTPGIYKNAVQLWSEIYDNAPLSNVAYINPSTKYPQSMEGMQISFVPMESVNEIYAEIEDCKNCVIKDSTGFTHFQNGDLLWAKITPCMENGKSAIAQSLTNGYGCGSTEFHVIRPKCGSILIEFIHDILHMKIVRETAKLYFGGSAGQQRVDSDFLKKIILPLPPISKQKEIVDCISNMRNKAKKLQEEGKVFLENAKQEVEQMIIGR